VTVTQQRSFLPCRWSCGSRIGCGWYAYSRFQTAGSDRNSFRLASTGWESTEPASDPGPVIPTRSNQNPRLGIAGVGFPVSNARRRKGVTRSATRIFFMPSATQGSSVTVHCTVCTADRNHRHNLQPDALLLHTPGPQCMQQIPYRSRAAPREQATHRVPYFGARSCCLPPSGRAPKGAALSRATSENIRSHR
jgi:hypothetical protein